MRQIVHHGADGELALHMVARLERAFGQHIAIQTAQARRENIDEQFRTALRAGVTRVAFQRPLDWLAAHNLTPPATAAVDADRSKFEKFLSERRIQGETDPAKREALFRAFMEWQKRNP